MIIKDCKNYCIRCPDDENNIDRGVSVNYYYENKDKIRDIQNEYYQEYYNKNRSRLLQHLTVNKYKIKKSTPTKITYKENIKVSF